MCTYAFVDYKVHYVCVPCRRSFKQPRRRQEPRCPRCARPMRYAGHDFAAPRRGDERRWRAVEAVLEAGLRYDGFEPCGCGRQPKPRPRTSAQVRARRRLAARTGLPEADALSLQL
ncbi:hypothetical protein ACFMQL_26755 [Nonomuraea fastidiosa]|jgi:hypothetical protein|uniref:hypothetical protein n=1 Tax=Nonomuraea TaxID=83681 RepID=UPI00324B2F4A